MTKNLGGFEFRLVGELQIARDRDGKVITYVPQLAAGVRPNPYATGPFCRFALLGGTEQQGVYAVFVAGELKYIGECTNLAFRFGPLGYGEITGRNCHSDGQSTNCKINALVLAAEQAGDVTQVWFCQAPDRKSIESRLIERFSPPWNGRVRRVLGASTSTVLNGVALKPRRVLGVNVFDKALTAIMSAAEKTGAPTVTVKAGDLHRQVGGYPGPNHRMPVCCSAMRAAMKTGDRIVAEPPKGTGASLTIRYALPRSREATL